MSRMEGSYKLRALFRVSIAVVKCHDKSLLGKKGFIWLVSPLRDNVSPLRGIKAGAQTWLDPRSRSWCRGHGGILLIALLLMDCSACFCTEFRTTGPGIAPTIMDWVFLQSSYRLAYSLILWRHFLSWGSLFSNDVSLCQVDIKLANTVGLEHTVGTGSEDRF